MWALPQLWLLDLLSADSFIMGKNKIFHLKYKEKILWNTLCWNLNLGPIWKAVWVSPGQLEVLLVALLKTYLMGKAAELLYVVNFELRSTSIPIQKI